MSGPATASETPVVAVTGRAGRGAQHGFVSLEGAGGFASSLGLEESYERLIEIVDRGLPADGSGP